MNGGVLLSTVEADERQLLTVSMSPFQLFTVREKIRQRWSCPTKPSPPSPCRPRSVPDQLSPRLREHFAKQRQAAAS